MSFPKYPEYKDSGVEWLGEVPAHWSTRPLWTLFRRIKRSGFINETLLSVYRDYGVIPKSSRADNFNKPSEDLAPYQLVEVGDLAINKMKAWQGSVAISNYRGIVSPAYFVYANENEEDARYLHYLFRCNEYTHGYLSRSKGIRVNQWDLEPQEHSRMEVLLPPRAEQVQIATFLNHETGKIDALIEEQRRLIELLKEKRQAVISHAVTKGLDPNVPMKDSGVEWLGEVPAHWDVVRMRFVCDISTGDKDTQDAEPEGVYPFFVRSDTIEKSNGYSFDGEGVFTSGDGAGVGKIFHHFEGRCAIHQRVYLFHNFSGVSGKYFFHFIKSKLEPVVLSQSAKSTVDSLRLPMLQNFWMTRPEKKEQDKIVLYVNAFESQAESLLRECKKSIDYLKERRSALISAAVTGKIDVRGWSAGAEREDPNMAMVAEDKARYFAQGGSA